VTGVKLESVLIFFITFTYVLNPVIVIQVYFRPCNKKVSITHVCNTKNGTTFSFILQKYLDFVLHIKRLRIECMNYPKIWRTLT